MRKASSLARNYNNELVKSIEDLREKREELNRQILKDCLLDVVSSCIADGLRRFMSVGASKHLAGTSMFTISASRRQLHACALLYVVCFVAIWDSGSKLGVVGLRVS